MRTEKFALLLWFVLMVNLCTIAQENFISTWTIEVQFNSVQPFGPSEVGAEIIGDYSPFTFDEKQHYKIGFKSSGSVRLGATHNTETSRWKGTAGFMSYRLGLIENFLQYEQPIGKISALDLRLSGLARLSGKRHLPSGLYAGGFMATTAATRTAVYNLAEYAFGMERPLKGVCFHWGVEFEYLWNTGDNGLYFGFNSMVTLPGLVGKLGNLRLSEDSTYEIKEDRIRAYAFGAGITVGWSI